MTDPEKPAFPYVVDRRSAAQAEPNASTEFRSFSGSVPADTSSPTDHNPAAPTQAPERNVIVRFVRRIRSRCRRNGRRRGLADA